MSEENKALQRLVLEALRQGHNVCTRTYLKTKSGSEYQAALRLRTRQGNIHVFFLSVTPTSWRMDRLARMVQEIYPSKVIIVNLCGGDWSYHLGKMAWSVTVTIDRFWDLVEQLGESGCTEEAEKI